MLTLQKKSGTDTHTEREDANSAEEAECCKGGTNYRSVGAKNTEETAKKEERKRYEMQACMSE